MEKNPTYSSKTVENSNKPKAKITAVIMASGHGKRFGSNKLLEEYKGKPLIENLFTELIDELFDKVVVVSIYDKVLELAHNYGFIGIKNFDTTDDTAITIRLGCENIEPESEGIMFFTGDQPLLRKETVAELISVFSKNRNSIIVPVCEGKRGNPVIFPISMKEDLSKLSPDGRGRDVINAKNENVKEVVCDSSEEFFDIDFKEDLIKVRNIDD